MADCNPQNTLQILDKLQALGFADNDFQSMHHIEGVSIDTHRKYCQKRSYFQSGGNNERLCQDLQKMLDRLRK